MSDPDGDSRCGPVPFRPVHSPVSTYRLQFHLGFTFKDATAIVPYLARLGVTDCYSSPYLMARPGSTHGYDICDHTRLNPEIGTEADYARFVETLRAGGLGQTVDFVPNHMGIEPRTNPWWREVLENGPSSVYGRFFDIDWQPIKVDLNSKVLLPILGDQYGAVLERGDLQLRHQDGALALRYFDEDLPINPRQATQVYRYGLDDLRARLGDDDPHLREFLSIITALTNLPPYQETDRERIIERHREKEVARERLDRLVVLAPEIRAHIDRAVAAFNGVPGRPETFDLLHELLEEQAYRLAYWRTAAHEINYRRFFDINALAGIRMEDPDVFAATHVLLEHLIRNGDVTGVRLDHPDGLFDPAAYFASLQQMACQAARTDSRGTDPCAFYVVAEKILSVGEVLPCRWPVYGTTGYTFLNDVNGLFVDQRNTRLLGRVYRRVTGEAAPTFEETVYECKKLIAETSLASELNVLAHALDRIAESSRRSRDFTLFSLHDALEETVACFPVYRTYVGPGGWCDADRQAIQTAIARARQRNPAVEASVFDFILEALLPRRPDDLPPGTDAVAADRREEYPPADVGQYLSRLEFSMKFQQYTAPVQAKGLEDTAFYRYNLLVSLNEVGGSPGHVGRSVQAFHDANRRRLESWPLEMTATATHDTKLGEDVRARVNVLSELPDEWRRHVFAWMRINARNRTVVDGAPAPDRNDEYRFYQVLVGMLPPGPAGAAGASNRDRPLAEDLVRRMREYMSKAIREAKRHTSWLNQNKPYDDAMDAFVERTLAGRTAGRFLAAFLPFQERVARLGMVNSLAQLVLKIASPGVPDFYQGTELWDLSLVDPDNRRPVDYTEREQALERLEPLLAGTVPGRPPGDPAAQAAGVRALLDAWPDGRIKLFVTAAGLRLRRARPGLFLGGQYVPASADMRVPAEVVAFARADAGDTLVVVAPRFTARIAGSAVALGEAWGDTRLVLPPAVAPGAFRHLLTGEILGPIQEDGRVVIPARDLFATCPVALLWHGQDQP